MANALRISNRPPASRRPPAEAPRLQLPMPRPPVPQAKPTREAEPEVKRGAAIIDFYI
ncbi:MAG: hypothetical protein K0V04_02830 [Deltaproteobacteria bacterium]|nr:hypothetical protein [Deltaproteobacteria bacterium]